VPDGYIVQNLLALSRQRRRCLAAWIAFKAASLSEQMLTYFSDRSWIWISKIQANIAYTSA
jgi:hypothetical protein